MDIVFYFLPFVVVVLFGWYFQIEWRYLLLGIPPFIIALFLERYIVLDFSTIIFLIIIAPVIEETLKFFSTIAKKDKKTGVAVGLMFAGFENMIYFISFSYSFLLVFWLRELSDPILHSTTTSIATRTWKGKILGGIGLAILMHSFWNFFSLLIINDYYLIWILAGIYFMAETIFVNEIKLKNKKKLKIWN